MHTQNSTPAPVPTKKSCPQNLLKSRMNNPRYVFLIRWCDKVLPGMWRPDEIHVPNIVVSAKPSPGDLAGRTKKADKPTLFPTAAEELRHDAEERRLAHVALTRAKRRLVLLYPTQHGSKVNFYVQQNYPPPSMSPIKLPLPAAGGGEDNRDLIEWRRGGSSFGGFGFGAGSRSWGGFGAVPDPDPSYEANGPEIPLRQEELQALGLGDKASRQWGGTFSFTLTQEDLRSAWRKRSLEVHPDKATSGAKSQAQATKEFQDLQTLYDRLVKWLNTRK